MANYRRLYAIVFVAGGLLAFVLFQSIDVPNRQPISAKINGVNLVAPPRPIDEQAFEPIRALGANWVSIIPYAFSRAGEPGVSFDHARQWWGERTPGVVSQISSAKKRGLRVMLKPHVWVRGEGWAGDFDLKSEADWQLWEINYADYVLHYAHIADSMKVEIYCIGTEYRQAVRKRPDFWKRLIQNVRKKYRGEVTYAANWDNYEQIRFWDQLDYIGIDAYFPIGGGKTPEIDYVTTNWKQLGSKMAVFADSWEKPVMFTEYGFRSIDFNTSGHWNINKDTLDVNLEAQAIAYSGLYEAIWSEPWLAGGFLWKWHPDHNGAGGPDCNRFTPQNKLAQSIISQYFSN